MPMFANLHPVTRSIKTLQMIVGVVVGPNLAVIFGNRWQTNHNLICKSYELWNGLCCVNCGLVDRSLPIPFKVHYSDVTMSAMAFQITGVSIVCSTVCSGADQRKHQSSASLAFVRRIHRGPGDSLHKGPRTLKFFPFDDVITLGCFPGTGTVVS